MSNEEQGPRDPGQEHDTGGQDGPIVDADDVVRPADTGEHDPREPQSSSGTPDAVESAVEPSGTSTDTAEAVPLGDAVDRSSTSPAGTAEPGSPNDGQAPAAATDDSTPVDTVGSAVTENDTDEAASDAEPDTDVDADHDDAHGVDRVGGTTADDGRYGTADGDPDGPVGGPYAFPPEGGEPGLGHPGLYPGTDPASVGRAEAAAAGTPPGPSGEAPAVRAAWIPTAPGAAPDTDGHPKRDRTRARSSKRPLLLGIGVAVVLLGLLIWLLVSLFGAGSDDQQRVDPSSLAAGECLADFTTITEDAVLADCAEPHNAQLVASESYPEDAEFPGRDQLGLRAEAACATASASIDPDVVTDDLQVTLLRATPTAQTWADGDRRVDCFAVVENGDTVSRSLLDP